MKQVKVKKIKKIPGYSGGGLAGLSDKSGLAPGKISQPQAITEYKAQLMSDILNKNYGAQNMPSFSGISALNTGAGVAAAVAQPIATMLGIEQGTAGQIGSGIGKAIGLINPVAGLAIEAISPFLGGTGGNDYSKITTTNDATIATTKKSGIIGSIFGKNTNKLHREANQYQNSLVATELTSNLRSEWANDPRNQSMTFNAKDGGIVPELVHAKVSKGELYYDPYNKTLSRVPGSPNKPNTNDDVDAFLAKGGMVVTNNDEQPLINGKTQAIALAAMVDKPNKNMSKGTIEARDRIIKKVSRLNELSKKENTTDNVVYANVGDNDLGNNENELLNLLRKKTKGTVLGKTLNPPADGDNRSELEKVRDRMKRVRQGGSYFDNPYQFTFSPQSEFGNRNLGFTTDGIGGFKTTNKFGYLGPQSTRELLYTPDISDVVVPTFDYTIKSTPQKTSAKESTPLTTAPALSRAAWAAIHYPGNPPLYIPEASLEPGKITNVIKPIRSKDVNTKDTDWEDLAYKAASILTPLFDREKVETTRLRRPTWHGIPVAVDALNQLQDAQLGHALANYNTTQGGYTAGQQLAARGAAASDLARKRAAIHQWQTEQQNKNIAQNIASLNAHSNVRAEIENKEIDINDANRAAARSVERQRRAEAMKNWGQVLRDKNQQAMDDMRMVMIEPLLQYAYENPEVIKKIYNKRGK